MLGKAAVAAAIALQLSLLASSAAAGWAGGRPGDPVFTSIDLCLPAIVVAVLAEGAVLFICARTWKKPVRRLLLACAIINPVTVTALSLLTGLGIVTTLAGVIPLEIAIWLAEARFLAAFGGTQTSWRQALLFSFLMNLGSLGAGAALLALVG